MAILSDDEVKIRIGAEISGAEQVNSLADQVEALGKQGGDAAARFQALAAELRSLGQQQVRVTGLETAITSAKSARTAFLEARHEVEVLDKALSDAKGASANQQAIKLLETELRAANRELQTSERAWTKQKDALSQTRAEAAAAGVDTRNLAAEQTRLKTALETATKAVADQQKALEDQRAAAAEEQRLAAIVEESKARQRRAAEELLAAEKRAYAEAEAARKAAAQAAQQAAAQAEAQRKQEAADIEAHAARTKKALSDAFSATGIRSTGAIQAEILQIQQGLQKLGQNAQVSGADFERAMQQAQQRIAALQAEMRGAADQLTNSLGRSTSAVDGFVGRLTPIAGAITAAFGVTEVARMAADFDSLNRSMAAIQGQGAKAAAEVAYLTDAANRLGLEVQSVSKTYTSWLASIKDTALEGEKGRAVFESVAGAMAKLGKSAADTDGAMMALGQMVSKGTVSMEELRQQLAERLPGAMQAAAAGAGLTVDALTKMVESGGVLAEDLLPGLASQLDKLYSNTSADGMVSSWNRLKNAVFETAGQIGQSEAVMASVGVVMGGLKETVLVLGTGVVTVAEGFGLLGKTIGATAAAIASGNWSELGATITKMADESAARINNLASQTLIAKGVQQAFSDSVQQSAAQAAAAASQYLAIKSAYVEVTAATAKQLELAEKSLAARKAESDAALRFVEQFGTEAEKRAEAADQATLEAAALQRVAEAKQIAADVSAAQLAALKAEVATMEQISPARKKELEELQRSADLKRQEAEQATAAAQAGQIRAAGLQTEAAALADNSKRVTELRDAWQAARAEADTLAAAVKAGAATKEQAAAAAVAAGQAEKLYRDSLSDVTAALQAQAAVARSSVALEERGASLRLEQIRTQMEVAKARGRDNEVAALQIEYSRVQIELAGLKAKALRAEADAQLALIEAKRAELEASGQLTKVKELELQAQTKAAEAKQVDARIAEELASRTRQLNNVVRSRGDAMDRASGSAEKLGESWGRAADEADRYSQSASRAGNIETRELRTGGVDAYAEGVRRGLSDAEAKRFSELMGAATTRANVAAQGQAAQSQGLLFSGRDYANLLETEMRAAAEQARIDVSNAARSAAGQTSQAAGPGTIVKNTYTVDLRTPTGTRTVKVADQASADTLISTLQELAARS